MRRHGRGLFGSRGIGMRMRSQYRCADCGHHWRSRFVAGPQSCPACASSNVGPVPVSLLAVLVFVAVAAAIGVFAVNNVMP